MFKNFNFMSVLFFTTLLFLLTTIILVTVTLTPGFIYEDLAIYALIFGGITSLPFVWWIYLFTKEWRK